jgi:beta-N-acetylhexosaminidase
MTSEGRRGARRMLAIAGLLMAVAAIVLFAVGPGSGDDEGDRAVPQGGSRFGGERATDRTRTGGRSQPIEQALPQLFVVGFPAEERPERTYGALLVRDTNYTSPSQLRALIRRLDRDARRARRAPPLLVADPAELGNLGPAPQPTIGSEGSPADARETARLAGRRLAATGIDLVLAPSADLGIGGTPAELRSFGDDPLEVARFTRSAVDGWRDAGILPVPGRFPGEGAASRDPIEGPATVGLSTEELVARDLRPFAASAARAPAIQMSAALYAAWDGVTPATLLPDAVRLARQRLGFRGAIVSADLNAAEAATAEGVAQAAIDALKAGCDLLLVPGGREDQRRALAAVTQAVRRGEIPRSRVDEALRRVAALKQAATRARRR